MFFINFLIFYLTLGRQSTERFHKNLVSHKHCLRLILLLAIEHNGKHAIIQYFPGSQKVQTT